MNRRHIILILFLLVAFAQWYVPSKMILDKQDVLETGIPHKFRTQLVDPYDPFRGKYIRLNFESNDIHVDDPSDWHSGERVYVVLSVDSMGFSIPSSISKSKPTTDSAFLETKVDYLQYNDLNRAILEYPFDRYYLEETKAEVVEGIYNIAVRDTSSVSYALVKIKNGKAVLKDVIVDEIPILNLVNSGKK
ncbi:MAG: GDYXXLXY domain-containing protein [Cyclobacteriaceae bacterium]